jgi:hypothetical protein
MRKSARKVNAGARLAQGWCKVSLRQIPERLSARATLMDLRNSGAESRLREIGAGLNGLQPAPKGRLENRLIQRPIENPRLNIYYLQQ